MKGGLSAITSKPAPALRCSFIAALLLVFLANSAQAATPQAAPHSSHGLVLTRPPFEFHSGFWLNLHHFLYEQALLQKQNNGVQTATSSDHALSPEQQKLWDSAVGYYSTTMLKRDFLFDDDLIQINFKLGDAEDAVNLRQSGINEDLIKVLESVAPVYQKQWWPDHDKANRLWIALADPLVQQFGSTLVKQLSAAYQTKWPEETIRVDVAEYANWAGAYTTFDSKNRVHTMVSTESPNQGFAALEILFHEASHRMVGPWKCPISDAIASECTAQQKKIPRDLWHAIIFYTAGEFTRRDLNEYRVVDYVPYAYKGLYTRAWPEFQRPLELYWQPYLEGKVTMEKAMSDLIGAL